MDGARPQSVKCPPDDRFASPGIDLAVLRKELEALALALEVRFEIEDEVVGACA